jgi:hypothetical protein
MRVQAKRKHASVPLPVIAGTATTLFAILALPNHPLRALARRVILKNLTYLTGTVPVFVGTGLVNIFKKSVGVAAVQLVTSFSLAAGVTANEALQVPFDAAVVTATRILLGTDSLYGTFVASAAVTTSPAAFAHSLTVEYEFIDVQGEMFLDADGDLAG